jgi:competence protein ComEC
MPLVTTFNQTGLAHLIAPSGFKVTILAGLVARSTRWLHSKRGKQDELSKSLLPAQRRKGNRLRWIATAPVILSILGYTFLSGGGPAALRAGIMGILLIVAPRMGRIYNIYTALALMALLMSISDPFVLWDTGFQLSMLGTLGIVSITPLLLRLFRPIERFPVAHHTVEIIVVTLAAEIATLPIFALSFQQVSLIAPVTNMLTVPLLGPILLLGMLVCGAGIISIHLGILCGWITWPLLWYVIHVVSWCAAIPGAFFSANNLDTRLAWGYYALLILVLTRALPGRSVQSQTSHLDATTPALLRRSWPVLQYAAVLIVVMATGATVAVAPPDRNLTITLLNVGPAGKPPQGEAILIHTPDDKTMLIDGGLDATSLAQELDSRLPFWQRTIDTVILTAPRQDHLNGLQDVVSRFQVNQVLDAGMLHPNT